MSANGKGNKRLTLIKLVSVNALVIAAVILVYFELQRPAGTNLQLNDFTYTDHLPDSNFNTSYVSVQGAISNLGPQTAYNVTLIVEIYVNYQNYLPDYSPIFGPSTHLHALIEKESLSIGSIEKNCTKEFHFDVAYDANTSVPGFFDTVKHGLVWAT